MLQAFGTYDLPVGKDRRFTINNRFVDAALGGWTIGGTLTAQSGTPFRLTSVTSNVARGTFNQYDSGVILVNGTTVEDLQNAIRISPASGFNRYWIDPKYIGADGRANPQYIQVPSEPGVLGQNVVLRGKNTWVLHGSLNKDFDLPGRASMRLHLTMTNVLNHPVWTAPNWNGNPSINSTTFGQTGAPYTGADHGSRQAYFRVEVRY